MVRRKQIEIRKCANGWDEFVDTQGRVLARFNPVTLEAQLSAANADEIVAALITAREIHPDEILAAIATHAWICAQKRRHESPHESPSVATGRKGWLARLLRRVACVGTSISAS